MDENLSPISIARRLLRHDLFYFTPALLADLFQLDRQVYHLIARLKAEGVVDEVEKGKYLLLGLEPERVLSNPLFIATRLVTPCYVSYWSALHFYGFTEQAPLTVFVATTKKKPPLIYRDFRFRFVTLKPHKFFGYRRERLGDLPVPVADEAKALVDSLDLPDYAGGIDEVAKALWAALESVEAPTLVRYANRMRNKSLGSRLGYLLERLGHSVEGLERSSSPVKLDPGRPAKGPVDPRWRVVTNVSPHEWIPQGVG